MYRDDIKLFEKKKKTVGESDKINKNIQSGYTNAIWYRKMCYAHNRKW